MGTLMAVSAAFTYLEEPLLASIHLVLYRRYIDDILFIWSGNLSLTPSLINATKVNLGHLQRQSYFLGCGHF